MSINLPPDLCLLESQVAGHTIESISQTYGMLRNTSGTHVFKPLSKPLYAEREIAFYKQLKESGNDSKQPFFPRYEGHLEMLIDGKKQIFIKLENLTHAMGKPCVMDIKIGRRTWDPLATASKIAVEKQKYAACKNSIGLCLPGFQIYNNSNHECLKYGKDFGKNLNKKSFFDALVMFLDAQNGCYKPLIKAILNHLYRLQRWFTTQTAVNFFSSSILIAYDYEALSTKLKEDLCSSTNGSHNRKKFQRKIDANSIPWVKVKMIDFAHVFESENKTCDANYLFGLQNLICMLQEILINNW